MVISPSRDTKFSSLCGIGSSLVLSLTVPGCDPSDPKHDSRRQPSTWFPDPTKVCSLPHDSKQDIFLLMGGDTSTTRRWSHR